LNKHQPQEEQMGKTVMILNLVAPKTRKKAVRPLQKHRDKSKYSRKQKHKAAEIGGFVFVWKV